VCPWQIELGLVVAVLVLGKHYLQNILNLGWMLGASADRVTGARSGCWFFLI
jgi:hypothetical protein